MDLQGKTLLLAWELGEGLGHLPAFKAIAGALKAQGVKPVFVLREMLPAAASLKSVGGEIRDAPHWAKPALPPVKSRSFADILASNGYARGDHAAMILSAWNKVIDALKPDAIICDHAPSAMLSAFGRIPVATVGTGFTVPPVSDAWFPPYNPVGANPENQHYVFDAIAEGMMRCGLVPPATITEAFRGDFRGIYSFPIVETYRSVRHETLLGPVEPQPPLTPLPEKPRLFVYTAADFAQIELLMRGLMVLGPEVSTYVRGQSGARAAVLRSRGVEVFDSPPPLAEVLPRFSAVFSHAGAGFTNAALSSGRPHIVFPRHFEARSTAHGLAEAGCGIQLESLEPDVFVAAYRRTTQEPGMGLAAQKAAADAHAFVQSARALETSVEAVSRLLNL